MLFQWPAIPQADNAKIVVRRKDELSAPTLRASCRQLAIMGSKGAAVGAKSDPEIEAQPRFRRRGKRKPCRETVKPQVAAPLESLQQIDIGCDLRIPPHPNTHGKDYSTDTSRFNNCDLRLLWLQEHHFPL